MYLWAFIRFIFLNVLFFYIEKYCEFDWCGGYVGKDRVCATWLKKSLVFKQMVFEIKFYFGCVCVVALKLVGLGQWSFLMQEGWNPVAFPCGVEDLSLLCWLWHVTQGRAGRNSCCVQPLCPLHSGFTTIPAPPPAPASVEGPWTRTQNKVLILCWLDFRLLNHKLKVLIKVFSTITLCDWFYFIFLNRP